jgi:hypothetical protein
MRHGKSYVWVPAFCALLVTCIVSAAAAQNMPRPTNNIPRQPALKHVQAPSPLPGQAASAQRVSNKTTVPESAAFAYASKTTFIIYDVGTLRMVGKSQKDSSYTIGVLRMTGRANVLSHNIGTLKMTGMKNVR